LNEEKKQQVIALGRLGWSLRRIQKNTGVRRETAAAYLKAAKIAFRPPGGWGRQFPPKPANEPITDFGAGLAAGATVVPDPPPGRSPSARACWPYREAIELGLSRGRNAMAIWQDLVDTCSFAAGYQSVRRFVSKLHPSQSREACAVIETAPGEEAQVDYGTGPMVRDPHSGKYRRTRLFVLTLGYSRKSVRLLVFRSSSQVWAELHEKAFRRLTGRCAVILIIGPTRPGLHPAPRGGFAPATPSKTKTKTFLRRKNTEASAPSRWSGSSRTHRRATENNLPEQASAR
jgi:transposase